MPTLKQREILLNTFRPIIEQKVFIATAQIILLITTVFTAVVAIVGLLFGYPFLSALCALLLCIFTIVIIGPRIDMFMEYVSKGALRCVWEAFTSLKQEHQPSVIENVMHLNENQLKQLVDISPSGRLSVSFIVD